MAYRKKVSLPVNVKPPVGTQVDWSHPLSRDLVGLWLFNEKVGNKAFDSTRISDATLNAFTWISDGKFGSALNNFSSYAQIPHKQPQDWSVNQPFSLSIWVRTTSSGLAGMIGKNMLGTSYRGYTLLANYPSVGQVALNMYDAYPSNWNGGHSSSTGKLNDGKWHHYVATYDGSSLGSGVQIYEDGVKCAMTNDGNGTAATNISTADTFIGKREDGYNFTGDMDITRIYRRVLTQTEVRELFKNPFVGLGGLASRTMNAAGNTTTTKTITGLSRVQVTTTKTVTGVSRITAATSRTITGVAKIVSAASLHDITYEIQVDTVNTFNSVAGSPLLDKLSATDLGFVDVTNGADTDPFATTNQISYTVQAGDALTDGTYYWRVRGKDPAGTNTWGAWATTRSFVLSTNTTTTKTLTGTARIQKSVTQTITGTARIQLQTTKTLTGTARIQKSASQTLTGVSRIQKTVPQTITGKARVQVTTTKTITGVSRIGLLTTKTLTGVSRVQKTVQSTISGTARVQVTNTKNITGLSRIQKSVSTTITGVSRIQNTASQTITGVASIVVTSATQQTITGVARITASTTQTIQGTARITGTATKTITGTARISAAATQTLTGVSRITATATKTIQGVARIQTTATATITGVSRVTALAVKDISGVSRITVTATKDITGTARINSYTVQDITGKSRITAQGSATITGTAKIVVNVTTTKTLDGVSRIQKTATKTITGTARIVTLASQTITGVARISVQSSQNLTGVSRITVTVPQTITGKSSIVTTATKTITGVANISANTTRNITGTARIAALIDYNPKYIIVDGKIAMQLSRNFYTIIG